MTENFLAMLILKSFFYNLISAGIHPEASRRCDLLWKALLNFLSSRKTEILDLLRRCDRQGNRMLAGEYVGFA